MKEKVLPCPKCQSTNLEVGELSALTYGVRCWDCNFEVADTLLLDVLGGDRTQDEQIDKVLARNIKQWNAIPR